MAVGPLSSNFFSLQDLQCPTSRVPLLDEVLRCVAVFHQRLGIQRCFSASGRAQMQFALYVTKTLSSRSQRTPFVLTSVNSKFIIIPGVEPGPSSMEMCFSSLSLSLTFPLPPSFPSLPLSSSLPLTLPLRPSFYSLTLFSNRLLFMVTRWPPPSPCLQAISFNAQGKERHFFLTIPTKIPPLCFTSSDWLAWSM